MEFATVLAGIRMATTAATAAKGLWEQFHATAADTKLDVADQALLKKELDNLRTENDALYEVTLAKLDAAAQQ